MIDCHVRKSVSQHRGRTERLSVVSFVGTHPSANPGQLVLCARLVPRWGRGSATVGLLTWVARGRATRGRCVSTRSTLRRPGRAARRRLVLLRRTTRGRSVLLLLATIAALRLAVALLLLTELTRAGNLGGALLVLSVVAGVNGTEDELQNPEIRGEVDGRVGASHLGGLVLVVGSAVDHASDDRVVVELAQELSG